MCPTGSDGRDCVTRCLDVPFYFAARQNLIDDVPDNVLTFVAPVAIFWTLSLFFHCLDISGWKWLDKYRIHESEEIKSRNLASRLRVICTVLSQHAAQTLLGYILLEEAEEFSAVAYQREIQFVEETVGYLIRGLALPATVKQIWELRRGEVTYFLYWWGIPVAQILLAMFVLDTWGYFFHRLLHSNKFLYKHFHSMHHRLYVPYAFGGMYSHPLEGFVLDMCGTIVAVCVAHLMARQILFLISVGSAKAVYDHCGYRIPFDPLRIFDANSAEYHDIHHQTIGMKYNFSQPFFTHWDTLLGTRLTVQQAKTRKCRNKVKAM